MPRGKGNPRSHSSGSEPASQTSVFPQSLKSKFGSRKIIKNFNSLPKTSFCNFPLPSWESQCLVIGTLQIFILQLFLFFLLYSLISKNSSSSCSQTVFLLEAETVIFQQRMAAGLVIRMLFLLSIIGFFFCNNHFTFPFFLSLSLYFILFIIIYPFFGLFHLPPSPTITTLLPMPMRSPSLTSHSRYKQVWFLSPLTSAKSRRNEIQHRVKILHFRTMCSSRKLSGLAIFFFFLPDRFLNSFHF